MKASPLVVFLPDTRGVEVSRYGMGNAKIGFGVFTYSRLPGGEHWVSLRECELTEKHEFSYIPEVGGPGVNLGTCPGSTSECEDICYAKRVSGPVKDVWRRNSEGDDVPPIPEQVKLLRLHIGGDFDTELYIESWIKRLQERPDVLVWAYTRSWRVRDLLPSLERLRALPNVQLFASMDKSCADLPPAGWRRAWIDGDERAGVPVDMHAPYSVSADVRRNQTAYDGTASLVCPEETGHKPNCVECGYCFEGRKNDVTFLRH